MPLLMVLTAVSGCWYSPWESLKYEAITSPASHGVAEDALTSCCAPNAYEQYRVNGVMCSVMLLSSGCYMNEHGPYTISVSMAETYDGRRNHGYREVGVKRVAVKMANTILWRAENLHVRLDRRKILNCRFVAHGNWKETLPDILFPKDGRNVGVEVVIQCDNGEERVLDFQFRPIIERGRFQTLD